MRKMMVPLMMLLASAPAFAQGVGADGAGANGDPAARAAMRQQFAEKRLASMSQKLGLDAAGTAALKATFTKYQAQLSPLRQDSWQTRQALRQELANATPNQDRISQLTEQLTANRQKMASIVSQRQVELKGQLTPEQYAKLVMGHHGFGRHGGGHHRGGGFNGGTGVQPATPAQVQ